MSNKQFLVRHGLRTTGNTDLANVNVTSGNVVVTGGSVQVGANVTINTTSLFVGNSTVNTSIVGGNVYVNGTQLTSGGAIPGSDTQVIFNDGGSVTNGAASFTFNKTTRTVSVGNSTSNAQISQTAISVANSSGTATISPGGITMNGGDLAVYRAGGLTGYVTLNAAGTRYIGYDGSVYIIPGANVLINGSLAWTQGNDGSGSGLDADTVDGYQASNFAILAGSPNFTSKISITGVGNIAQIANTTGSLAQLEIQNNGTGAAAIAFHRTGSYAGYFGLDADNVWRVGGWSYGDVAHTLWHSGNDGSGSGLDADLLDGYSSADFARKTEAVTFTAGTVTVSAVGGGSVSLNGGDSTKTGYIGFANTTGSRKGYIGFATEGGQISFYANENSATGLSIVGNTNVTGTMTSTSTCTASAFNTSSDARLKKKKRKIKESDFINIDYMSYDMYNTDKEFIGHHYGALAQDVEKTHPHLIDTDEKGFKRLNYTSLHTLELAKLKHLIETQNKYIEKLEKRLSKLEGKK